MFADSRHVVGAGLASAADVAVWDYARAERLTIVSKDSDFNELALSRGPPPKVIWLRIGNSTTDETIAILNRHADAIVAFDGNQEPLLIIEG